MAEYFMDSPESGALSGLFELIRFDKTFEVHIIF